MKRIIWPTITLCLLASCTKLLDELLISNANVSTSSPSFKTYVIRKGNHFADSSTFTKFHKKELRFVFFFDSTAIYTNLKGENQLDINKLYGFSDCGTMHHENSARFGWRWNGSAIEIHAYWYTDSTRQYEFLDTVAIGSPTECTLSVSPNEYRFEIKNKTRIVPRHCSTPDINGYQLHPYFGGDEPAPHDITIHIKEY